MKASIVRKARVAENELAQFSMTEPKGGRCSEAEASIASKARVAENKLTQFSMTEPKGGR